MSVHSTTTQAAETFDIAAREAEINGKPQRIRSLAPEEFDAEAAAMVTKLRATLGLSTEQIPAVFGLMLRHPGLFKVQMDMGVQLFKGEIGPREREIAVLRVGWLCRAPFEWGEHVDIAKSYGLTSDEIERVTHGSTASGWNDHERTILKGVEELFATQMLSDETWNVLAKRWSEAQLIEFPMLVGQYYATALQQNALRVTLAKVNPGLRHR